MVALEEFADGGVAGRDGVGSDEADRGVVEGDDPGALGEGGGRVAGARDLDADGAVGGVLGEGERNGAQVVVGDRGEDERACGVAGEARDRGPAHHRGAGEVERERALGE